MYSIIGLAICIGILLWKWGEKPQKQIGNPLPEPTMGLPIVGQLHFRGTNPLKAFRAWTKTYGNIYRIRFGSIPTVILSDTKLIHEAFALKSLSGRPNFAMWNYFKRKGLVSGDSADTMKLRKFALIFIRSCVNKPNFEEMVANYVKELPILKEMDKPGKIHSILGSFELPVIHMMWKVVFADDIHVDEDALKSILVQIKKFMIPKILMFLRTFIPASEKIIPELLFPNDMKNIILQMRPVFRGGIEACRISRVSGCPRGFVDAFLDEADVASDPTSPFLDEEHLISTCFDLFTAGTETTSTNLEWLIYFLACNPRVQKNLQKEIDRVVGRDVFPRMSHRPQLPYAEAIIQEMFRLSSTLPLGLSHRALEDTQLRGFTIRKNDMIHSNVHHIHMNPETWEEPEQFQPERFLSPDGRTLRRQDDILPFAAGRRSCVGESFARNELFLYLIGIFQTCNVHLASKSEGEPAFGFIRRVLPYKVTVCPRI